MARKHCPQCKLVTGASSATCSRCGHVFAPVAVAATAPRGAKRCLECGLICASSVARCQCGFDFDIEPEDLRGLLAARRSAGWSLLVGSVALGVLSLLGFIAVVALVATSPVISVKAMLGGFFLAGGGVAAATKGCRKGLRILDAVRESREELAAREAAVPQARIHR